MKYYKTVFFIKNTDGKKTIQGPSFSMACDICAALCGTVGYESFEENEGGISGYIQKELYDRSSLEKTLEDFPLDTFSISFETEEVIDKNWNEEWEKGGFNPIIIGDQCIIHDLKHPSDKPYPIDITIDACQAFGTGTHNTTRMIVEELLKMTLQDKRVLDCGCGTGILSVTAAKCGAVAAYGYDIDEWSVSNTIHNAKLNSLENVSALKGDSTLLYEELMGKYDVVLANINRNILLNDLPTLASSMADNGTLIISGFYKEDESVLIAKARALGLVEEKRSSSDNWAMIKSVKRQVNFSKH